MTSAAKALDLLHSAIVMYQGSFTDKAQENLWKDKNPQDPDIAEDYLKYLVFHEEHVAECAKKMQELMAHMRSRRNSLSKINTLPNEVLCNVLIRTCEWTRLALSHTCSQLRSILLRSPTLWSDIFIPETGLPPDFLNAIISRSLNSRIHLTIGLPEEHHASRLLQNMSSCEVLVVRLVSLSVRLPINPRNLSLPTWMREKQAPVLHTLSLHHDGHRAYRLPIFFEGGTPLLETLHLNGCEFPWASRIFGSSLVELQVHSRCTFYPEPPQNPVYTQSDIALALQKCAQLRTLSLEYCQFFRDPLAIIAPTSIPSLRHLRLKLSRDDIDCILNVIDLHHRVNVMLKIDMPRTPRDTHGADADAVVSDGALSRVYRTCTQMPILDISHRRLLATRTSPERSIDIHFQPPGLDSEGRLLSSTDLPWAVIKHVVNDMIELPCILHLLLDDPFTPHFSVGTCIRLLQLTSNLTCLDICNCKRADMDKFWDMLRRKQDVLSGCCDNLENIVLSDCALDPSKLVGFLAVWRGITNLKTLTISECSISGMTLYEVEEWLDTTKKAKHIRFEWW